MCCVFNFSQQKSYHVNDLKNCWYRCHVIVKWSEEGSSREYRISASCLDTIFSFALSQLISLFEVASVLAVIITSLFPWFMKINRFMWMAQIIKCTTYCIWRLCYFGLRQFILFPRKPIESDTFTNLHKNVYIQIHL